jgi:hypothetical protein
LRRPGNESQPATESTTESFIVVPAGPAVKVIVPVPWPPVMVPPATVHVYV